MSKDGLFTDGSDQFGTRTHAIPLRDADAVSGNDTSIGQLVSTATEQISSLVRSELELAKTELATSAKKGAIGGGLFGVAGTIALYSSFFLFFFLAELLAVWLDRWAAFLIVFLFMLVLAGILAFVGFKSIKKVKKPQATIESAKELKSLVPSKSSKAGSGKHASASGLYT